MYPLSQKQEIAEMRFKPRQSGSGANGEEENPRRGRPIGQIYEVRIRVILVSVHCVLGTVHNTLCMYVRLCAQWQKLWESFGMKQPLGIIYLGSLTSLCQPPCTEFLEVRTGRFISVLNTSCVAWNLLVMI